MFRQKALAGSWQVDQRTASCSWHNSSVGTVGACVQGSPSPSWLVSAGPRDMLCALLTERGMVPPARREGGWAGGLTFKYIVQGGDWLPPEDNKTVLSQKFCLSFYSSDLLLCVSWFLSWVTAEDPFQAERGCHAVGK